MVNLLKSIFFAFLISNVVGLCNINAQNRNIDSLTTLIKKDKADTNKVIHLNALARQLMYNNPDTSILLGKQALFLAKKLSTSTNSVIASSGKKAKANALGNLGVFNHIKGNYVKALDFYFKALKLDELLCNKSGIAIRLGNIGAVYWNQGDYSKALQYYHKALKLDKELKNKNDIAADLTNIGLVYNNQADYPKAQDYFFKALNLAEELQDKNGIAFCLGNIGLVYWNQGNYTKTKITDRNHSLRQALDYFFKALKLHEELGDKNGLATMLGNIGLVYLDWGKQDEARNYFLKALQTDEALGNKNGIARHLGNLGIVYFNLKNFPEALNHYFKALKIDEELENKNGIARHLCNIGSIYTEQKKYTEAEIILSNALKLTKEIGTKRLEMEVENHLTNLYTKTKHYELALQHFKNEMALKDSIFNEAKNKEITRKEMNYEFEKKESATKALQDKKDAIAKEELKQKEQQRNYFIAGFGLVAILALFIFRSYRQKKNANFIITQQKEEVEKKNHIIEEKQKEIIDSIKYARRIQNALLPTEKYIDKKLNH